MLLAIWTAFPFRHRCFPSSFSLSLPLSLQIHLRIFEVNLTVLLVLDRDEGVVVIASGWLNAVACTELAGELDKLPPHMVTWVYNPVRLVPIRFQRHPCGISGLTHQHWITVRGLRDSPNAKALRNGIGGRGDRVAKFQYHISLGVRDTVERGLGGKQEFIVERLLFLFLCETCAWMGMRICGEGAAVPWIYFALCPQFNTTTRVCVLSRGWKYRLDTNETGRGSPWGCSWKGRLNKISHHVIWIVRTPSAPVPRFSFTHCGLVVWVCVGGKLTSWSS